MLKCVNHVMREHNRDTQEILTQVLSAYLTPLDSHIEESINILQASMSPEECMNQKFEWRGMQNTWANSPHSKRSKKVEYYPN